jgi:hypothetical protein
MSKTSAKSARKTSAGRGRRTSSEVLAVGTMPSASRVSRPEKSTDCGRQVVHASHSTEAEQDADSTIRGISGLNSRASLASANLNGFLASNLQAAISLTSGSMEYVLTWSEWATPAGRPCSRLRAQVHRRCASGFIGALAPFPTPDTTTNGGRPKNKVLRRMGHRSAAKTHHTTFSDVLMLAMSDRGVTLRSSISRTGANAVSDPEFACWLMGYPITFLRSCPGFASWELIQRLLEGSSVELKHIALALSEL